MTAIEVACPHQNPDKTNCGVDVGEQCDWQYYSLSVTYGIFHKERIEAAAAMTQSSNPVSRESFDTAVEKVLF